MYFNNNVNESTNIDKELNSKNQFNFEKYKMPIYIGSGVVLLGIITLVVFFSSDRKDYSIELNGNEDIVIALDHDYVESGFKAFDKDGNDVSDRIKIDNNIDISKVGDYEIVYSIGGSSITRKVHVKDVVGETYFMLLGNEVLYLNKGDLYTEPGYKAIDTLDGNITNNVIVDNKLNTNVSGTYQIVYTVTNSSGITTSKKRTIIVK